MKKSENKENIPKYLNTIRWSAGIFTAMVFLSYFFPFYLNILFNEKLSGDPAHWSAFGEYIGGILSPILAFLALIALLHSIRLQTAELNHSTEQLKKSAEALDNQNKLIQKQNFEATFFHLVGLYNQIIQGLSVTTSNNNFQKEKFSNRECFFPLLLQFNKIKYEEAQQSGGIINGKIIYFKFKEKYENSIEHYFKIIFNIIEFIDGAELSEDEKYFYANIFQAQLSFYELALIHINLLHSNELKLPIIRKYKIIPENSAYFKDAIEQYPSV
ncbi:putative phage abortive infection protein [Nitrosomonas oligotropha]|uniref:putative phage abortive infection protein n=1 Tax=Nitrosomonas oligotropha TaxID=42354 RepID=UPI00136A459B|nr:putative phage abortive infection protein [Nitrosomonas oligotropha]MXS82086.1 hypothetical protein [Nitrosomonas oligotropha]